MPKPNKKRIEDRTEAALRAKGAGKLVIPKDFTSKPIEKPISDKEFEDWLVELLTGKQGYGKNYRRRRPKSTKTEN